MVVLFDDPEQDKFVFWPIKNLSEAEMELFFLTVPEVIVSVQLMPWAMVRVHYSPMPAEVVSVWCDEGHGLDTVDREHIIPARMQPAMHARNARTTSKMRVASRCVAALTFARRYELAVVMGAVPLWLRVRSNPHESLLS